MPDFPIIDTHLHIWDMERLNYSAFEGHPLFGKSYQIEDYQRDCENLDVEAMVFLECYADFTATGGQYFDEIAFVEESAQRDDRIKAIIPMAPLEWGARVEPMLAEMKEKHPTVRGIRRIVEFDDDPRALTLSDDFIAGVNLLEKYDFLFEINVNYTQMDIVREFVTKVPHVRLILDHCGKPGIAENAIAQFRDDMTELAQCPNLWIKLSDLPAAADHAHWREEDLRPFIEATFEAFGFERVLYAGDYPICLQATSLTRWVDVLDRALAGSSHGELRQFYRDNANSFYRLGL